MSFAKSKYLSAWPQPVRKVSLLAIQKTVGEQISDNHVLKSRGYLLGRRIAKGTFGTVVRAKFYDATLGTDSLLNPLELACKVIDKTKSKNQFLKKFLPRELHILERIDHPNIIKTHSIIRRERRVFIFMRLAERGDLQSFILKRDTLSEERSRFWFYQMADAIRYLHRLNIAHRDLKCENVLISKNMNIKLSDFGFARTCINKTGLAVLSKTFCGSAAYAAPEIISGKPYIPKSVDLWSLGVVLFMMLNGLMPFDETNLKKMLKCQLARQFSFRPEVEKVTSLDAIRMVRCLLEPDPIDRINIDEVLRERWEATKIREAAEKINKYGVQALPALQSLKVPAKKIVVKPAQLGVLLEDGRAFRVAFSIIPERLDLSKQDANKTSGNAGSAAGQSNNNSKKSPASRQCRSRA